MSETHAGMYCTRRAEALQHPIEPDRTKAVKLSVRDVAQGEKLRTKYMERLALQKSVELLSND